MVKRVKKKQGEKLDEFTVSGVIDLLESDNPITKKEACQILNISYNTTRLNKIIASHKEDLEREAKLRAKNRGKKAQPHELTRAIEEYLDGGSISEIAKGMYRSTAFVKNIIRENDVPERSSSTNYFFPELLPEGSQKENFKAGEIVWSARYNTTAVITGHKSSDPKFRKWDNDGLIQVHPIHGNVYRIHLRGKRAQFAAQPWYELASLSHLEKLGVKL